MADDVGSALRKAFEEGVLVLKDSDRDEAWTPTRWEEVQEFLGRRSFSRVIWPRTDDLHYVRQFHIRGASVHEDFRYSVDKGLVTGLTVTVPFGLTRAQEEALLGEVEEALAELGPSALVSRRRPEALRRALARSRTLAKVQEELFRRWAKTWLSWQDKHVCVEKAMQDESWLRIDFDVFRPGDVGATDKKWAFLWAFDRGRIHYGAQKPDYREFFLESPTFYVGRVVAVWLPKEQARGELDEESEEKLGRSAWVGYLFTAREQQPYVASERCLESGWVPPPGRSCLPKPLEGRIPRELRFWEKEGKELRRVHEAFVRWANEDVDWYVREEPEDWPESLEAILLDEGRTGSSR